MGLNLIAPSQYRFAGRRGS